MNRLKHIFISTLILVFSFSTFAQATSLGAPISNYNYNLGEEIFTDVFDKTPNGTAIKELKDANILNGYDDGDFRPSHTINRAEFLTLVMSALGKTTKGSFCFPDVKDEYFAASVCTAKMLGITDGYENGLFDPGRNINLAEAGKIIANANNFELEIGGEWYAPALKALGKKKAIPASIDRLTNKITRGEVAEMLNRLRKNDTSQISKNFSDLTEDIPRIRTCGELYEKLRDKQYSDNRYYYFDEEDDDFSFSTPIMDGVSIRANPEAASGVSDSKTTLAPSEARTSFSQTNIQVENVDESDTVKNNGSHIFFIQNNRVKIVKAYPTSSMSEIATIELPKGGTATSLYLTNDKLIVMGSGYRNGNTQTGVYIYDIEDPSDPDLVRTIRLDGSTISTRRIGNNLYLVLNQYQTFGFYDTVAHPGSADLVELEDSLPTYYDSSTGKTQKLARCHEITYFPRHKTVNYLIVAGIPLDNNNKSIYRDVMLGASNNVYSSSENLYVASNEYNYDEYSVFDTWDDSSADDSYTDTRIHQFGLKDGQIEYKQSGIVPGKILNQFSMDEYQNSFRIATTSDTWPSSNNLYVLNKNNLDEIQGKIEDIAPGEDIFSVRFMGDRTYMVTFEKIDPFFVIDTSNPYAPKILGKLKIPGFSNYLHPYDENHIIGIGKDSISDAKGDFSWYQGLKVALFNVEDVKNPKEISKVIIGTRGSTSPVLKNHRAILFSKDKGFLAFPLTISEHPDNIVDENRQPYDFGDFTFQGAHIYNIDTRNGISKRGEISHITDQDVMKSGSYWYATDSDIKRIIYIGENFYTISNNMVKATNMTSMIEQKAIDIKLKIIEADYDTSPDIIDIILPFFR